MKSTIIRLKKGGVYFVDTKGKERLFIGQDGKYVTKSAKLSKTTLRDLSKIQTGVLYKVNYLHTYINYGFLPGDKKRHICLRKGDWCIKNLIEYPFDIFYYLRFYIWKILRLK